MVTIAKGSFDDLESPTMESQESGTDHDSSGSPVRHISVRGLAYEDDDEHDTGGQQQGSRSGSNSPSPSTTLEGPLSSRSLRSMQSGDQVLDLSSAIDLSDSSAIVSRINRQKQNQQTQQQQQPAPQAGSSPVKVSRQTTRGVLSRRPSMHETHDCEVLMKSEFLYYLYSLAILGTSIRIFLGRFFGQDCESPGEIGDFLSPLSEQICVTATGETSQKGGALFVDLPANMLGCFIMGIVSSLNPESGRPGGKLPWLRKDHPLQQHEALHHAIKIGLCGSLTTFSSWNAQMVTMLDGSETALGPQVVPALFGYIIGMSSATSSFVAGGRCYEWLYNWSNGTRQGSNERVTRALGDDEEQPTSWDSEDTHHKSRHSSSSVSNSSPYRPETARKTSSAAASESKKPYMSIFLHQVLPFLLVGTLLVLYGVADGVIGIQFYRELWASCLLTPLGVHLRWKFATLNGRGIGPKHRFEWVPWGTLICNLLAVMISVIFQALRVQYLRNGDGDSLKYPWVVAIVVGMKTGLAGSLSTVSSMVKEIVNLGVLYPTHAKATYYGGGTIVLSIFLGLCIYSPIMRHG